MVKLFNYLKSCVAQVYSTLKHPGLWAIILGASGIIIVGIPILTYMYFASDLTSKEAIINRNNAGVILLDRNGTPFFTFYEAKTKKYVELSEIPLHFQHAVIAIEDKDFYDHPGFSIPSIIRAFISNVQEERLAYGASTITQQLVKNALLNPKKNFLRKYQEVVLSIEIDRKFNKEEILEMYLNSVYLGEGAIGIENAAHTYFGKTAKELTLAESTLLAGILPAPSRYSPISGDVDEAYLRQRIVLQKMVEQNYITPEQKLDAEKEELSFISTKEELNLIAPHFAIMVKDELIEKYGPEYVARSGFIVKTTLDSSWQEFAETTVSNQVANLAANNASNASVVVMDPKTGEVKALVGSVNWYNEDFGKVNVALSNRQVGSSFKPIIYAKALEQRLITTSTILNDSPTTFPGNYKPENYDKRYRGKVTVRRALANSLNIPAVEVMEKVGVDGGLEVARRLGITSLRSSSDYGLSLVLGTAEIPLIEMTRAFSVFANGGKRVEPTLILEIKDKRDRVVFSHEPVLENVLDENVAFLISSILSDNRARAEVFGSSLTINRTAAVKTGTTEDYRDALTIGFTPSLVVGVWVGNNDNTPMDRIAGSLGAAPIWRILMNEFHKNIPDEKFTSPLGVSMRSVCFHNGLLVRNATSSAYPEYFLNGTEPTKYCDAGIPTSTTSQPTQPGDTPTPTPQPTAEPTQDAPAPTSVPDEPAEPEIPIIPTFQLEVKDKKKNSTNLTFS